ncbi:MAG TPA: hypothetical protein VK808_11825 [Bacteroidia bacterium]|nr:hypothetical protein [Bacteroidia bacterium]
MRKLKPVFYFSFFIFHFSFVSAQQWYLLPNSPAQTFRHDDLYFINRDTGWVVNVSGQVWNTKDGGNSWTKLINQQSSFRCVGFFDSIHGCIGNLGPGNWAPTNDTNPIYYTSDGARTLTLPTIIGPKPTGICGLSVVNDTTIMATGRFDGPPYFMKSTDQGKTFYSQKMDSLAGMLIDTYFMTPDSGFVVGGTDSIEGSSYSVILFTADGGHTWTKKITGTLIGNHCWKITHPSKNVFYVSVEELYSNNTLRFFKSTDRGNSWTEEIISNAKYGWSQGIGFVSDSEGWVGGNTYALHTRDSGKIWDTVTPSNLLVNLNRVRFLSDTLAYAVGQRVYKYYKPSTVGVSVVKDLKGYSMSQNVPNPFTKSTIITYSIPETQNVQIEVFDDGGRKIKTLVNEIKFPGTYTIEFIMPEARNFSFICSMLAGPFAKRIKMVSVK